MFWVVFFYLFYYLEEKVNWFIFLFQMVFWALAVVLL